MVLCMWSRIDILIINKKLKKIYKKKKKKKKKNPYLQIFICSPSNQKPILIFSHLGQEATWKELKRMKGSEHTLEDKGQL